MNFFDAEGNKEHAKKAIVEILTELRTISGDPSDKEAQMARRRAYERLENATFNYALHSDWLEV